MPEDRPSCCGYHNQGGSMHVDCESAFREQVETYTKMFGTARCPRCGDTVESVTTGDGNRLGLCGHVWKDGQERPSGCGT